MSYCLPYLIKKEADILNKLYIAYLLYHVTYSSRYLIEKGADIALVNSDGELAIDLAEGEEMEQLLSEEMEKQGR